MVADADDKVAGVIDTDIDFASGDAGSSSTYPQQCSALRRGGHVMIKGHPCKIVEMSTSKTGKHGHAKVHLVGMCIFTNKKYEEMAPSTHNMDVPHVKRQDYQLVGCNDGFLSIMDDKADMREDLKMPDGDIGTEIQKALDESRDILVTVMSACGEEAVVGTKVNNL